MQPIKRALISVSNKEGIIEFASQLHQCGIEIISTGGTYSLLTSNNIPVKKVSEITNFPEILDGRVKTLHPVIHAGILAVLDNPQHKKQLEELKIQPIDLVVINLYPFEETIAKENISLEEAIENIDIGGPAMLRAAAKNYRFTTVATKKNHYKIIVYELQKNNGTISETTRFRLAQEAFQHTAYYDSVIANYLLQKKSTHIFSGTFLHSSKKVFDLRYGENPHQKAALYGNYEQYFHKLHGKELSYNNIIDVDAAVRLVEEFSEPTVAIIKHTNPCGVASGKNLTEAYRKAFATDTKSPFGGIIAVNHTLDKSTAEVMNEIFTEIIIAPSFEPDALEFLMKKKDRRLLISKKKSFINEVDIRSVHGGVLVQTSDSLIETSKNFTVVTKRKPTEEEMQAMFFAWKVAKHVKSNAIVYALHDRTLGIGAGQMSRVDSSKLAVWKAQENTLSLKGSAVASDAFFPFADGLLEAISAGATAVIQPGGSVRDNEVIAAADEHNVAMVFTGVRHFKH